MKSSDKRLLSDLGEFGLIGRIRERFRVPEGVTGIGDDCAVLPQRSGRDTLVSTDMLIEGTHFLRADIPPYRLGWKSAAVNISDIAAMGGSPTATFLSVALPADLEAGWMEEFLRGYAELSGRFGAALLGGDTTASPDRICINVAVIGECPCGAARLRSLAREGDLVCVTGCLGDSAGGLKAILEGVERDADVQMLIDRHYLPLPRVAEGLRLAATPGVHAMMDISDGIGSDLQHILDASSGGRAAALGAKINLAKLPLSEELRRVCARLGWDAFQLAIGGGEDYELLFTCTPEAEQALDVPHTVIGEVTGRFRVKPGMTGREPEMTDIEWRGADRQFSGFDHFRKA
ncbi:MAG: thiamine-phosphate kinase [Bacteroidales bacterium]|nr:thiamine-phosphate kinase [Bacteroidales bacterium]